MLLPAFAFSPARSLGALLLGLTLAALSPDSRAGETAPPALDAAASYQEVVLKELVARSKTEVAGQRIIFAPAPVKFRARLAAGPAPQKADYLLAALGMMRVSNPPKVSQRIGLDFGGDKALAAYIDDAVVDRLNREVKVGDSRTFYAFHVYNNHRGPALLVISFGD